MPPEVLIGADIPALLAEARKRNGPDARLRELSPAPGGGWALHLDPADGPTPGFAAMRPEALTRPAGRGRRPWVLAVVGPTGSGKTTTLAKLANHAGVFGDDAVGMICLDTYRIGAVEQSRAYAELSRVPLEVAYEPRELAQVRRRLADRDVWLVDTAGRARSRPGDLEETRALLAGLEPDEVHLTLPAGLDERRARSILAQHRVLGVTHLLATKRDEFREDRVVFALAAEHGLPLRWLTHGQEVPADLAWAGAGPGREDG